MSEERPTAPSPPEPEAMRRPPRREWIAGLVLIGVGVLLMAGRWLPDIGEFVVLVIGLGLLALFAVTRAYGVLVPAGIVTGVGLGMVLEARLEGAAGSGLFLLSLGGGFLAIWLLGLLLRLPQNHWWPLVPGGIIALVGAIELLGQQGRDLLAFGWPLVLVALGVALVARAFVGRDESA